MDIESRLDLVKGIAQEIVTEDELRNIFETNKTPVTYDGFEPSGLAHLPIGIYRPLLIKDLLKANVKFKLLVADSFGWINEKMGGDLDNIRTVGKYFVEVWKAAGVDTSKIEIVHHKDHFDDGEYWKKVMLIAKNHTEARTLKALQIAGRKENEVRQVAQLFYPSMQAADIFQLGCDFTQLGLDQRKANMLARDVAEKLHWKKPAVVSHRMLLGLDGIASASSADEESAIDREIDAKMSKSKPDSCIFVHDSAADIKKKINKAYCPEKTIAGNPILEYNKEIVFRAKKEVTIERPAKFGGSVTYTTYKEMEMDFVSGKLHPMDLKNSTSSSLDDLIKPIREHFEKNKTASALYEEVKAMKVTR